MTGAALELKHCDELHITVGLFEHEAVGITDDRKSWPYEAERRIAREFQAWRARNPFRVIVCAKAHASGGQVMLSFWHDRPPLAIEQSSKATAPAIRGSTEGRASVPSTDAARSSPSTPAGAETIGQGQSGQSLPSCTRCAE